MDVLVQFDPRHRWPRSPKKPSVLGGGLLERVRSTTLALLGVTTAVGLAIVALALNQSWPLVAGSPIPGIPPLHEEIGKAKVAAPARAGAPALGLAPMLDAARSDSRRTANPDEAGGAHAPDVGVTPSASAELVVAPSAPAEPQGDAPSGAAGPAPTPSPAGTPPQAPTSPVPVSGPGAQAESAPPSPPVVEPTPPPTSAEAPVDSSDDDDEEDGWDDDDEWDDGRWHGHDNGHHWSRGRHDD